MTMKSAPAANAIEDQARPVRIGVSACLLGERVRFDGGHKRNDFLVDILGPFVQWVAVCPEVEFGLGTPRRSLRLVANGDYARMVEAPKRGRSKHPEPITPMRCEPGPSAARRAWTAKSCAAMC
jgi:hypothetical protein